MLRVFPFHSRNEMCISMNTSDGYVVGSLYFRSGCGYVKKSVDVCAQASRFERQGIIIALRNGTDSKRVGR